MILKTWTDFNLVGEKEVSIEKKYQSGFSILFLIERPQKLRRISFRSLHVANDLEISAAMDVIRKVRDTGQRTEAEVRALSSAVVHLETHFLSRLSMPVRR